MSMTHTRPAIVKEITMKASPERIFRAFTVPEERLRWWSRATHNESDLRVGGRWESRGEKQDGGTYRMHGTYLEVDPPHLLVFTWRHHGDEFAEETIVRVELEARGEHTLVRLTHTGFTSEEMHADHLEGWDIVLGWLGAYVTK
jgi:uncharacterized protein YndB with AHSA1/START domain